MEKIDCFLNNTQNEWKKVLPELIRDAKNSLLAPANINLIDFSKGVIPNLPNDFGIYLFRIRLNQTSENSQFESFSIDKFKELWDETLEYSPNIIQSRIPSEPLDLRNWHPLYVGKSEKLVNRINEHCFQEKNKKTYSLKLKHRVNLLSYFELSYSYYRITDNNSFDKNIMQFVLVNLEYEIRKEIKPWIGKQ